MRTSSASRSQQAAAVVDETIRARWTGGGTAARRPFAPTAVALLVALAAAPFAGAQGPPPAAEPAPAPPPGKTVLVIPPAAGTRPAEVQTQDEYVLRGGLDERAPRKLYQRAADAMDGYRSVLTLLSTGRLDDGLEALYAFETSFMEGREPQDVELLFAAEVEVIRTLGRRDVESLVPPLVLHHDAYDFYLRRDQPILAGHSSRVAASLADLYARVGGSEGSRVLGARALASLGIAAQQAGVKLQGLGLMLHALELDPDNHAALLGIATVHERSGNYHRAAERLLSLLESAPTHREGRLRMAVNLDRLGSTDSARRLLEELLGEARSDWVATVAAQELGRVHREAGRLDAAERVLRQALERFPQDGRLRTQLAFVLDRQREPSAALQVVDGLGEGVASAAPSPRRLYGMGPQESYHELIADLRDSSNARMPRLARLVNGSVGDRPAG